MGERDREGATCLFPIAVAGEVRVLKMLIAAGLDVNAHDHSGRTPLLVAVSEGQGEAIRVLLDAGAKAVVRDDHGTTPLHLAADRGDLQLVETLIGELKGDPEEPHYWGFGEYPYQLSSGEYDFDDECPERRSVLLNLRNGEGQTPLHFVANSGECEDDLLASQVVARFLAAGAEPNTQDNNGATPLHLAAANFNLPSAVCVLLEGGASPKIVDRMDMTPLHCLVMGPEEKPALRAFEALVDAGAELNAPDYLGRSPLHLAVTSEHAEEEVFIKALLEAGANPNARDRRNRATPLHYALQTGDERDTIVRALVEGGADVNAKDDRLDQTALHMAISAEQARILIDAGAQLNARDAEEKTPLHVAAAGNAEVAGVLVEAGANPYHGRDYSDWMPIQEADEHKVGPAMVWALVGAPNGQNEKGQTPLHIAAECALPNWMNALLEAGADPNVRDQDGRTALHKAHDAGSKACVEALIAAGASTNIQDKDGNCPGR